MKPPSFLNLSMTAVVAFAVAADMDFLGCGMFAILFTPTMYAVYGGVVLLILMRFLYRKFETKRIAVMLLFSLAMVSLYYFPTTSRKPFLRDLSRIHNSMTITEVEAIMGKYIKGYDVDVAEFYTPDEDGKLSVAYRHSTGSTFGSDLGVVKFEDGKVVSTEFWPD